MTRKRPAATKIAAGRLRVVKPSLRRYGVPPLRVRYCATAAFTF